LQRLPTSLQRPGPGLQVQGLRGVAALTDPFIAVDHFHMTQPTFPPHPHAGFSAVTYLFDDAQTGFLNRDSLGHEGPIQPGDLHWTLAGAGVMHEEFPLQPGLDAHGLQIFVNLSAATKMQAPRALHLTHDQMPRTAGAGWRAVLVFGALQGLQSPLALPVQASLLVVDVDAGASFVADKPGVEHAFVMIVSGQARVGSETVVAGDAFAVPGALQLQATQPLRLALFSGQPLAEPIVQHGPFVMNSEAQIVDAMRRYKDGGMGRLASAAMNHTRASA
jgi:redox-sensitive bicupin YhaK (pirin superfamily)